MSTDQSEQLATPIAKASTPPVERPRWLWPQRIPIGCLTLLAGEPRAGKSNLTFDFAARVSRGGPWPGECSDGQITGVKLSGPGSVLLVCIEDSWQLTIRPQLAALGADLSKIQFLPVGEQQPSDMRIEMLQKCLYRSADCRLIVIDPVSAFLNELGGLSGSRGRRLVYLLAECVRNRPTALVLVTHLRAGQRKGLQLPSGSDALIRAARAAWLLAGDPADSDRRLLLSIKNNLGPPPSGLAFTFESVGDGEFARLQWEEEPVPLTADEYLRDAAHQTPPRDHKLLDAVAWLKEILRDERSVPAAEVQLLAKARGISYGTLRRAFGELGCESVPSAKGEARQFFWRLRSPTDPA